MEDGLIEILGIICELFDAQGKIILFEEPETVLHPNYLKKILNFISDLSQNNQIIITTHSNIAVMELISTENMKLFEVIPGSSPDQPSTVAEVPASAVERRRVLEELGYDFSDLGVFKGFLILEESSAERVIRDILIPNFCSKLQGKLRTYSSRGAGNVPERARKLLELVVYVNLQPMYEGRLWVRVDNDPAGREAIAGLGSLRDNIDAKCFKAQDFERYYPARYHQEIKLINEEKGTRATFSRKGELAERAAKDMVGNPQLIDEWRQSAAEIIDFLKSVEEKLAA